MFAIPNAGGVTTALLEDQPDALSPRRTSVSHLRIVTSGPIPPNRAEILSSPRLDSVLASLRDGADLVLVDSPPITAAADASVLAPRVDGVVLVIDAKRTRPDLARRARSQLDHANARILGVVITNATVDSSVYRY
ncbi:MAG: hypothetical protein GEU73_04680 [Chloroflexi bacterium]|nr:hypothetical protein [Chloroflexota bacterium]